MKKIFENDFDWVNDVPIPIDKSLYVDFSNLSVEEKIKIQEYVLYKLGFTWGDGDKNVKEFYATKDLFKGYVIYPENKNLLVSTKEYHESGGWSNQSIEYIDGKDFFKSYFLEGDFDWVNNVRTYEHLLPSGNDIYINVKGFTNNDFSKLQDLLFSEGFVWSDGQKHKYLSTGIVGVTIRRNVGGKDRIYYTYTGYENSYEGLVYEGLVYVEGSELLEFYKIGLNEDFDWVDEIPSPEFGEYFDESDLGKKVFIGDNTITYKIHFDEFFGLTYRLGHDYEGIKYHEDYDLLKLIMLNNGHYMNSNWDNIGPYDDDFYDYLTDNEKSKLKSLIYRVFKLQGRSDEYDFENKSPDFTDLVDIFEPIYSGEGDITETVGDFQLETNMAANINGWNDLNSFYLTSMRNLGINIRGNEDTEVLEITVPYPYIHKKYSSKKQGEDINLVYNLTDIFKKSLSFLNIDWNGLWLDGDASGSEEAVSIIFRNFYDKMDGILTEKEKSLVNEGEFDWVSNNFDSTPDTEEELALSMCFGPDIIHGLKLAQSRYFGLPMYFKDDHYYIVAQEHIMTESLREYYRELADSITLGEWDRDFVDPYDFITYDEDQIENIIDELSYEILDSYHEDERDAELLEKIIKNVSREISEVDDLTNYLVNEIGHFEDLDNIIDRGFGSIDLDSFIEALTNKKHFGDLSWYGDDFCRVNINENDYICIIIE